MYLHAISLQLSMPSLFGQKYKFSMITYFVAKYTSGLRARRVRLACGSKLVTSHQLTCVWRYAA